MKDDQMTRPAHNSTLPLPLIYKDKSYVSLMSLWKEVEDQAKVSLQTFSVRLRNRLKDELINDAIIDECHLMDITAYKKYGVRKTYIKTSQGDLELKLLFNKLVLPKVGYDLFRQRIVKINAEREVSTLDIEKCAFLNNDEWRAAAGGGRSKTFFYDGHLYPDAVGEYPSFAAFLRKINRYEEKSLLTKRKRAQWDIDDLLSEPVNSGGEPGYIYKIEDLQTGKLYVGLSINKPKIRFGQHVNLSKTNGKSPLQEAIRKNGRDGFFVSTIEEVDGNEEHLAEREKYWIEKLNTLVPYGLNVRKGGQIGYYQGKEVVDDKGRKFKSKNKMARVISRETGIPEHVVISRFDANKPLPEKARSRSWHPEAGTPLFRQWLGMKQRAKGDLVDAWLDYDTWKSDISQIKEEGQLTRIDSKKPWGPENCMKTESKKVKRGKPQKRLEAFGKVWDSQASALRHFKIPSNVFLLRLKAGWDVEKALSTPIGKTSKKNIVHEGEKFDSINQASKILSKRYNMTFGQVKDRLSRKVPLDRWPVS